MTVIAWDGKTLAADKRTLSSGLIRTTTKVRRIGDLLVGTAGDLDAGVEMMEWIANGRKPEEFPVRQRDKDDFVGTLVIDGGRILRYERSPIPLVFEDSIFAIGSGRDFALAAMHCGKSAPEAVEVASHFEAGCGNGVDVLSL